jgi:hypothetical protein
MAKLCYERHYYCKIFAFCSFCEFALGCKRVTAGRHSLKLVAAFCTSSHMSYRKQDDRTHIKHTAYSIHRRIYGCPDRNTTKVLQ